MGPGGGRDCKPQAIEKPEERQGSGAKYKVQPPRIYHHVLLPLTIIIS